MEFIGYNPYPTPEDDGRKMLLEREWSDKVKGYEFDRRHLRWHESLEGNYAPHITY